MAFQWPLTHALTAPAPQSDLRYSQNNLRQRRCDGDSLLTGDSSTLLLARVRYNILLLRLYVLPSMDVLLLPAQFPGLL